MRKNLFHRILFFCIYVFAFSSAISQTSRLIPYRKGTKWGYANDKKVIIVPAKYDSVDVFTNGIGTFKSGELWGYIDAKGKEIVPATYYYGGAFYNHYASARTKMSRSNSVGLVNKSGTVIIPFEYDQFIFLGYGLVKVKKGSLFGLFDTTGKEILKPIYKSIGNFSQGFATIQLSDKYGYIDSTGKIIITPEKYISAAPFSNGWAVVGIVERNRKTEYSYINARGTAIGRYAVAGSFSDHVAVIRPLEKKAYEVAVIDTNHRQLYTGSKYMTQIESFKNGTAIYIDVVNGDSLVNEGFYIQMTGRIEKRGLISRSGKIITPPIYDRIYTTASSKFIFLKGRKYGLMDMMGKELLTATYDNILFGQDTSICLVKENGKWTVFSENGKKELLKKRYDSIGHFYGNIAVIFTNNKYGYIDKTGKEIIPPSFEYALPFGSNEVAFIIKNGMYGLIDKKGKIVREPKYDVRTYKDYDTGKMMPVPYYFLEGISRVIYKGVAGYIDASGKEYWEN